VALRNVVSSRTIGWNRPLEFHNGSIVTTTGFAITSVIRNGTKEQLKDSIRDTLRKASFLVDRNTIRITRVYSDQSSG